MRRRWIWWLGGTVIAVMIIGFAGWNLAIDYILKSMISNNAGSEIDLDSLFEQLEHGSDGSQDGSHIDSNRSETGFIPAEASVIGSILDPEGTGADHHQSGMEGERTSTSGGEPERSNHSSEPADGSGGNNQGGGVAHTEDQGNGVSGHTGNQQDPIADNSTTGREQGFRNDSGNQQPEGASSQTPNRSDNSKPFGYEPDISMDKAKQVKDKITLSEKTKVTTVLVKNLSANEISTLIKLASNGLTVEEKKQAKLMLLEKLSEKEYDELIAIAHKYGLSEGKKYSEQK